MYFRDPKKELPKPSSHALLKLARGGYTLAICSIDGDAWRDDMEIYFIDDVVGWMPVSELDSITINA